MITGLKGKAPEECEAIPGISRKGRRMEEDMTGDKYEIGLVFVSFGGDDCTKCKYVTESGDLIGYVNEKLCCRACVHECAQYNADSNWLGE
jgi:hypothetical protein